MNCVTQSPFDCSKVQGNLANLSGPTGCHKLLSSSSRVAFFGQFIENFIEHLFHRLFWRASLSRFFELLLWVAPSSRFFESLLCHFFKPQLRVASLGDRAAGRSYSLLIKQKLTRLSLVLFLGAMVATAKKKILTKFLQRTW